MTLSNSVALASRRTLNKRLTVFLFRALFATLVISLPTISQAAQPKTSPPIQSHPSLAQAIKTFAGELKNVGYQPEQVEAKLLALKPNQEILKRIRKPAEAMAWYQYRPIWMKAERISAGAEFYRKHQQILQKAQQQFQVDPMMITAIIGIETFYGRHKGGFRVLDALYTLGFHYPKRAPFFRKELKAYFQLAKTQGWSLDEIKGSYAGAMGMGQFIPSSYQHYGIDYDGDGKVDLFHSAADMIGSVANYFAKHHWRDGQFIAMPLIANNKQLRAKAQKNLKLELTYSDVEKQGTEQLLAALAGHQDERFSVYDFKQKQGKEFWLTGKNFHAITRYNRSKLYARAAVELSEAIRQELKQ